MKFAWKIDNSVQEVKEMGGNNTHSLSLFLMYKPEYLMLRLEKIQVKNNQSPKKILSISFKFKSIDRASL